MWCVPFCRYHLIPLEFKWHNKNWLSVCFTVNVQSTEIIWIFSSFTNDMKTFPFFFDIIINVHFSSIGFISSFEFEKDARQIFTNFNYANKCNSLNLNELTKNSNRLHWCTKNSFISYKTEKCQFSYVCVHVRVCLCVHIYTKLYTLYTGTT